VDQHVTLAAAIHEYERNWALAKGSVFHYERSCALDTSVVGAASLTVIYSAENLAACSLQTIGAQDAAHILTASQAIGNIAENAVSVA
jgi:hypothetical protein